MLDQQIEDDLAADDGVTVRAILASGRTAQVTRDDMPPGHVIRLHPDGSEEVVRVDVEALAALLG